MERRATFTKVVGLDRPVDVPHQHGWIEFIPGEFATRPAVPPDTHLQNDWFQFQTSLGQGVTNARITFGARYDP